MLNQLPTWENLAKKIIWQQIGKIKDKTILDFGSGTGITADYFAADNQVTAIEPSEDMLAQQVNKNGYRQIVGSTEKLKKLSTVDKCPRFVHEKINCGQQSIEPSIINVLAP